MRPLALLPLTLLAACGTSAGDEAQNAPEFSELYQNVDASFSDQPIGTPLEDIGESVPQITIDRCAEWGECEWRNDAGVRHYFADNVLTVKLIAPRDFEGREINALGIGVERERDGVLDAAGAFLEGAEFTCVSGDTIENCSAAVRPGWVTLDFGADGALVRVKLDGDHFN